MISKFRRGNDKKLISLKTDINELQNITSNNDIINVINPVSGDLNMNNNSILATQNIDTKKINNKDVQYNPSIAELNMNNFKITNLPNAVNPTDAISKGQSDTLYLNVTGDLMQGNINMSNNRIINLGNPLSGTEAINRNYLQTNTLANPATTTQNMNNNRITNLPLALSLSDPVTVDYLQTYGVTNPVTSNLNMNNFEIQEVKTIRGRNNVPLNIILGSGGSLSISGGEIFCGNSRIGSVALPLFGDDVATRDYVDGKTLNLQYNPSISNLDMKGYNLLNTTQVFSNDIYVNNIFKNPSNLLTEIGVHTKLNLLGNNIEQVSNIVTTLGGLALKGNDNLILECALSDIKAVSSLSLENNNINNINQLTTKRINGLYFIRQESDLPNPITTGTYIICNQVTLTSKYTIVGDCSFYGFGKESELRFLDVLSTNGYSISSTNYNLSFCNLKFSNIANIGVSMFNFSNIALDKILKFTNCLITDNFTPDLFNISGYDLVDINQCIFINNKSTTKHLYVSGSTKLQITSCEFSKQLQVSAIPVIYGTANMIDLYGSFTSVNINNCYIHSEQTQKGVFIADTQISTLSTLISNNTFNSTGQTTGSNISYNVVLHPELWINNNNGILNIKSVLEGFVNNNTTYTVTNINNFVPIRFGPTFAIITNVRFEPTGGESEFKYIGNQPINCLINATITATHNTGGDDICRVTVSLNGANTTFIQALITQGTTRTFTYTKVYDLVKNDILQFRVINITANSNQGFLAQSLVASLTEF